MRAFISAICLAGLLLLAPGPSVYSLEQTKPLHILVILGGEHHRYEECTRIIVDGLKERLDVTADFVRVDNPPEGKPWAEEATIPADPDVFSRPEFAEYYDLILCYDHYAYNAVEPATREVYLQQIRNGMGWVGIHSASSTYRDDPEYIRMVGGYFTWHEPYQNLQIEPIIGKHPVIEGIGAFEIKDELYYHEECDLTENRVIQVTRSPMNGAIRPVTWTKTYGKGRVFYTLLGHDPQACRTPELLEMLANAVLWVSGQ